MGHGACPDCAAVALEHFDALALGNGPTENHLVLPAGVQDLARRVQRDERHRPRVLLQHRVLLSPGDLLLLQGQWLPGGHRRRRLRVVLLHGRGVPRGVPDGLRPAGKRQLADDRVDVLVGREAMAAGVWGAATTAEPPWRRKTARGNGLRLRHSLRHRPPTLGRHTRRCHGRRHVRAPRGVDLRARALWCAGSFSAFDQHSLELLLLQDILRNTIPELRGALGLPSMCCVKKQLLLLGVHDRRLDKESVRTPPRI
mmetsp:Transcript_65348/g.188256  ORF Transcript_65348/g.188256 Transcript_65348/m.188256 type:complete len:256 (-) Transcript_65348:329-1096(-)